MEDKRLDGAQESAIVSTTETTAEAIPEPTARLVEKSFADNTVRNRKQALRAFSDWLRGREITDGRLAEYATYLFDIGKTPNHEKTQKMKIPEKTCCPSRSRSDKLNTRTAGLTLLPDSGIIELTMAR